MLIHIQQCGERECYVLCYPSGRSHERVCIVILGGNGDKAKPRRDCFDRSGEYWRWCRMRVVSLATREGGAGSRDVKTSAGARQGDFG